MFAEFLLLAFAAGVTFGLWIAVLCRPAPKVVEREREEEESAEYWWNGGKKPEM